MAYARASKEHELVTLRDEITKEVNADASHVAKAVFGDVADMPDTARISNERLDQLYRQAYARNDRQWLQAEARRDPQQFMKVAERLGVQIRPQQPFPPAPPAPPAPPVAPPMPLALPPAMPQTIGGGGIGLPSGVPSPPSPLPMPPPGLLGP